MGASSKLRPKLVVDLAALQSNYRKLAALSESEVASVVKADAYGLGLEPAARALWAAGCRSYFTAFDFEALSLRDMLADARIYVMVPGPAEQLEELIGANCIPCLYAKADLESLIRASQHAEQAVPVALHLDTGINRLGLTHEELRALLPALKASRLAVDTVMTHLACGDDPDSPMNDMQLDSLSAWRDAFPNAKFSIANSGGLLLSGSYQQDLARPGLALYGCDPHAGSGKKRFDPVACLSLPIAQIRHLQPGERVGYGAAAVVEQKMKVAVLAGGYADGINRLLWRPELEQPYQVFVGGKHCPLFGRVSMDLITIDVSQLEDASLAVGTEVEIFGPNCDIELYAQSCGTISYEVLTSIGSRVERIYKAS